MQIGYGAKKHLAKEADYYKGVSSLSIGSEAATNSISRTMARKQLKVRLQPVPGKEMVFRTNLEGYDYDQFFEVANINGLTEWVEKKYSRPNAKWITIRGKDAEDYNGIPPLGSVRRDFFEMTLIYLNSPKGKAEFGLK